MRLKPAHASTSAFSEKAGVVSPTALVEATSMKQSTLAGHSFDGVKTLSRNQPGMEAVLTE